MDRRLIESHFALLHDRSHIWDCLEVPLSNINFTSLLALVRDLPEATCQNNAGTITLFLASKREWTGSSKNRLDQWIGFGLISAIL
jgi:hypothetical protein